MVLGRGLVCIGVVLHHLKLIWHSGVVFLEKVMFDLVELSIIPSGGVADGDVLERYGGGNGDGDGVDMAR